MNIPLHNSGLFDRDLLLKYLRQAPAVDSVAMPSDTRGLKRWLDHRDDDLTCWRIGPAPLGRWWIAVEDGCWRLLTLRGFSGPSEYIEVRPEVLLRWDPVQGARVMRLMFARNSLEAEGGLELVYRQLRRNGGAEAAAQQAELEDRGIRHSRRGFVSTPPEIVEYMVDRTVAAPGMPAWPRIMDPAVGWGAFLIGAGNALLARHIESAVRRPHRRIDTQCRRIVSECLYGVERDAATAKEARRLLGEKFCSDAGARWAFETNIRTGDALACNCPQPFDVTLGNPPWVSFGLRGADALAPGALDDLRRRFPASAEYKISLFALFIELAMRWTRAGGRHAFIVPDSLLTGRYYSKVRTLLQSGGRLESVDLVRARLWSGVAVGGSVVYVLHKTPPAARWTVAVRTIDRPAQWSGGAAVRIPLAWWSARPHRRMIIVPDRASAALVRKIDRRSVPLGAVLEFYSGLIGRQGKQSIVVEPDGATGGGDTAPLIESGRRLRRFAVEDGGWRVRTDPRLFKSGWSPEKYAAPKLLLNQTGAKLKACVDRRGYFCLNNLHIGSLLNRRWGLDFLAAWLNSAVIRWYYGVTAMETGRALAQTDIDMLHTLPLPPVKFDSDRLPAGDNPQVLHDTIDALARQRAGMDADASEAVSLEQTMDRLLYRLYGLNEREIGVIEGGNTGTKS